MELPPFVKKNSINMAIIIGALFICRNIYNMQSGLINSGKQGIEKEMQRNTMLQEIGKQENKLDTLRAFLNKKDANFVINTITLIAQESGVIIVSIKPHSEQDYPFYKENYFDLTISASDYHVLGSFISRLESSQLLFFIKTLTANKTYDVVVGEGRKSVLRVNLMISTMFFK